MKGYANGTSETNEKGPFPAYIKVDFKLLLCLSAISFYTPAANERTFFVA